MEFGGGGNACCYGGDLAILNKDGLVFDGRGAGAVDDADVGEENLWGVDFDVAEDVRREGLGLESVTGRVRARIAMGAKRGRMQVLRWDEFTRIRSEVGDQAI